MTSKPEPENEPKYKTRIEAAAAISSLSEEDRTKLLRIASIYWSDRGLNDRWGSSDELLAEAFLRTLSEGGKRWREGVPMLRHLKRAMENISGHLARKRNRLAEHEVEPNDQMPLKALHLEDDRSYRAAQANEILEALQYHFGPDQEAFEFLIRRSHGRTESEAAASMGIEDSRVEAVARRCRRKVATFKKRSNQ